MNLIAKPSKENIKTYIPIGLTLVFFSLCDVFINAFFSFNIMAFLPFDFIFLLVSLTWITKGRPIRLKHNTHKWFKKLIVFHIIVSLSMLIMYALNMYDQNNSRLIYNLFPIYLICLILYFTYGSSVFIKKDISVQR